MKKFVIMGVIALSVMKLNAQDTMTLQQLFDIADVQNRNIHVSQIELKAAGEAVEAARKNMLPDVNVSIGGSYIGDATLMSRGFSTSGSTDVIVAGIGPQTVSNGRQSTPHWGNTFSAQATQVIYAGGAIRAALRMAELGQEMLMLDVERNRQEVRFLITGYYLDLYKLGNQIQVIDENIALTDQLMSSMKARYEQGVVLKNDITRYELQRKGLELSKVKLKDAMDIIGHQLSTILRMSPYVKVSPDTAQLNRQFECLQTLASQDFWIEMADIHHIGMQQAQVASAMAEQRVRMAKAEYLPKVAVVLEDQLFGPYTSDLIPVNANVNSWFVGVGAKLNLSSIWKNRHNVSKAVLDVEQSRERIELARDRVGDDIQTGYVNLQTTYKELETHKKQLQLAEQNYHVVANRYQNELALITDMLDASNTILSAQMAMENVKIELLYCYFRLRYITNTL